ASRARALYETRPVGRMPQLIHKLSGRDLCANSENLVVRAHQNLTSKIVVCDRSYVEAHRVVGKRACWYNFISRKICLPSNAIAHGLKTHTLNNPHNSVGLEPLSVSIRKLLAKSRKRLHRPWTVPKLRKPFLTSEELLHKPTLEYAFSANTI